eukprot:CAMPEP_0203685716 /NCGR_PEP_ID=MMETSP0090-20130426/48692_1 /ASSEMBLY_ACC=CAM_ASM_001088 /TAXON_ID=426623 /ORGANISM="Chaetoceros affinis, Strain CCMP159" /LENGTH=321 /DNA_ID=CAMNT_0050554921 /DNA_START=702 /DNA_END=1663 /DNA_ORIENTATION=+
MNYVPNFQNNNGSNPKNINTQIQPRPSVTVQVDGAINQSQRNAIQQQHQLQISINKDATIQQKQQQQQSDTSDSLQTQINHVGDKEDREQDISGVESAMKMVPAAVLHKKTVKPNSLYDIAAAPIASCISPVLKLVVKNIEIVRLMMVSKVDQHQEKLVELWPGVSVGGAALQCRCCKASKRRVLNCLTEISTHVEDLGLNHLKICTKVPKEIQSGQKIVFNALENNPVELRRLKSEIQVFGQHLLEHMRKKNSNADIPIIRSGIIIDLSCTKDGMVTALNAKRKCSNSKAFGVEGGKIQKKHKAKAIGYGKSRAFDVQEL